MQLSYAQRLEDYHLDLIFAGRDTGFYVDVGGGHPVADNVSYWFYLKGWRGLVIEPQRDLADLYAHVRPRDTVLRSLVGSREGEADFHTFDRLHGFSTMIESQARAASEFGVSYTTSRMPVRTLASILAEHGVRDIDFLKIDVEGAEKDVLAGMDWQVRPRVLVIEAMAPANTTDAWLAWEPDLLARDYVFAFEDSLNRFYVAAEAGALCERFPSAPAPYDSVRHLWDFGRVAERPDHPDHTLAMQLVAGFLAAVPTLDRVLLADLLRRGQPAGEQALADITCMLFGDAEFPGRTPTVDAGASRDEAVRALIESDRVRAALGRIASAYDGGHVRH